MADSTALTVKQKEALFNSDYTGITVGGSVAYPPVINILQSDKQYKAFGEAEMSNKMHGKLFVRTDSNKVEDLLDEIEGTAIKIEAGYEVRDGDQKIVDSNTGFLDPDAKETAIEEGLRPMNMVKVLMALGTPEEMSKRVKEYGQKVAKGTATKEDYPFALLVIKGSSWGSWIEAQDKMEDLCQKTYQTSYHDTIASLFRLSLRSEKQYSPKFGDYYSFEVGVELNDPDTASLFAPMVFAGKNESLFWQVGKRTQEDESDSAEVIEVFKDM